MRSIWKRYDFRLLLLFLFLLAAYLLFAYLFHTPRGYYGTLEQPRFADPWLARTETILSGGLLYRDTFTATPPLTNFLLIVPSVVALRSGVVNPWATGAFMVYFALFNLFTALLLLYLLPDRQRGFRAAVLFLANPLTFGNAVLRRQDESIIVFFLALALLLLLRQQHVKASIAAGLSLLIKLSGALLLPIAFLHTWNWRYLVIPLLVFLVVLAPFLVLAGEDAIFWNVNEQRTQHPFQIRGVSLASLWNRFHDDASSIGVDILSTIFLIGSGLSFAFIVWRRAGILRDLTFLAAAIFLFSPKLHTGYFSILTLTMVPLVRKPRQIGLYLLFGVTAMAADFYKWPIENFEVALVLQAITLLLMVVLTLDLYFSEHPSYTLAPAFWYRRLFST